MTPSASIFRKRFAPVPEQAEASPERLAEGRLERTSTKASAPTKSPLRVLAYEREPVEAQWRHYVLTHETGGSSDASKEVRSTPASGAPDPGLIGAEVVGAGVHAIFERFAGGEYHLRFAGSKATTASLSVLRLTKWVTANRLSICKTAGTQVYVCVSLKPLK